MELTSEKWLIWIRAASQFSEYIKLAVCGFVLLVFNRIDREQDGVTCGWSEWKPETTHSLSYRLRSHFACSPSLQNLLVNSDPVKQYEWTTGGFGWHTYVPLTPTPEWLVCNCSLGSPVSSSRKPYGPIIPHVRSRWSSNSKSDGFFSKVFTFKRLKETKV